MPGYQILLLFVSVKRKTEQYHRQGRIQEFARFRTSVRLVPACTREGVEESMYFTQLPQIPTVRILPQNTTHLAALGHFSWNTTRRKGRGDAGWLENVVGEILRGLRLLM
jgi:hypothetical protein